MKNKNSVQIDVKPETPSTHISQCSFIGVQWDKSSLETINLVAKGLVNLTELFKTQNVEIEALLKITSDKKQ